MAGPGNGGQARRRRTRKPPLTSSIAAQPLLDELRERIADEDFVLPQCSQLITCSMKAKIEPLKQPTPQQNRIQADGGGFVPEPLDRTRRVARPFPSS
jgi:hypothetical protein